MRNLLSIILIIGLFYCSSSKKSTQMIQPEQISVIEGCPDKADCEIKVYEKQAVEFHTEKSTGKFFPEFIADSTKTTIKVIMNLNRNKAAVDGQYREEIIFEWPRTETELHLENEELQEVKFLFGRFCFCPKEQVGYFKITKGDLNIKDENISIEFENNENIPQILKQLQAKYKLK